MNSAWINQLRQCHLVNTAKSLIIRVGYDGKNQWMVNSYKTINWVVDYFSFNCCHAVAELLNQLPKQYAKVQIPERFKRF